MKALILLHGALGSASVFEQLIPVLSKDYEIFTFNLSGHGDCPFNKEGFGIDVFAQELDDFITSNALQQPMIFGYSMGGYVALHLEAIQPGTFSKIVTLGTKFNWSPDTAKHEVKRLVPVVIEQKVPAFAQMLSKRHHNWKDLMEATANMMLGLGNTPLLHIDSLRGIQLPVIIMRGDQDQMVSKEESVEAAEALSNGSFLELADTPHPIEKVDPLLLVNQFKP